MNSNPYAPPTAPVADPPFEGTTRPRAASFAVRMLWSALVLGVLQLVSELFTMARTGPGPAIVGTIAGGCLALAILALFTFHLGRRRNWARIVFIVLFWLGIAITAMTWQRTLATLRGPPLDLTLTLLQYLLQAASVILLSTPGVAAWYKRTEA